MRIREPRAYEQGTFNLTNPAKYFGAKTPKYKSSFELRFMEWCDKNKNVIKWAYEPYHIDYIFCKPPNFPDWVEQLVDGKQHKYFIDFHVELIDNKQLIDFNFIPIDIQKSIKESYHKYSYKPIEGRKIFNFFVKHKMSSMLDEMTDFVDIVKNTSSKCESTNQEHTNKEHTI